MSGELVPLVAPSFFRAERDCWLSSNRKTVCFTPSTVTLVDLGSGQASIGKYDKFPMLPVMPDFPPHIFRLTVAESFFSMILVASAVPFQKNVLTNLPSAVSPR